MGRIKLKSTQKTKQLYSRKIWNKLTREISAIENKNRKSKICTICSSKKIDFYIKKNGFNIYKCSNCGLLFSNPYPSIKQLEYYYNSEMKEQENRDFRSSFERRIKIFLPRVKLIKKYLSHGKLLDIGPAIGVFIEALNRSKHNYSISCCDINIEACNELKKKYKKVEVYNKDYAKINKKFDIITMWDTIEHIPNLNQLFKKVRNLLKKNGLFFFSTPNTKSFEWIVAGKKHGQIVPPAHVNLMNIKNIKILFKKKKFKLVDVLTLNPSLDIDTVLSLIKINIISKSNLNNFFKIYFEKKRGNYISKLKNKIYRDSLENFLIKEKLAGNALIIGKKI